MLDREAVPQLVQGHPESGQEPEQDGAEHVGVAGAEGVVAAPLELDAEQHGPQQGQERQHPRGGPREQEAPPRTVPGAERTVGAPPADAGLEERRGQPAGQRTGVEAAQARLKRRERVQGWLREEVVRPEQLHQPRDPRERQLPVAQEVLHHECHYRMGAVHEGQQGVLPRVELEVGPRRRVVDDDVGRARARGVVRRLDAGDEPGALLDGGEGVFQRVPDGAVGRGGSVWDAGADAGRGRGQRADDAVAWRARRYAPAPAGVGAGAGARSASRCRSAPSAFGPQQKQ